MGKSIVDIKNMADALRNTGYKDIESAVSEIVDNSVEAKAKNVFIIMREKVAISGRKAVSEIGFLDDGEGMNTDVLGSCLGLGASTRRDRKGMGRFGVGLPQASLYACPEVEVYSWQNGIENTKKVYLNINEIKEGKQTEIADPVNAAIPAPYNTYINYKTKDEKFDFSNSGTLVIWKKCDRINPKTQSVLVGRLEFSLGQKYRYFLHDGDCKIRIIPDDNQERATNVMPNDPLFLMDDNYVLCDPNDPKTIYHPGEKEALEAPFELYTAKGAGTGETVIPVKYIDKNGQSASGSVKVRFSIVKNKFYDETAFPTGNPGDYAFGKHAAKLEGISVVRAKREIDFRHFDFFDPINKPNHRWWGCEIIFEPELDEAFGVANNKQYVELKKVEVRDLDSREMDIPPIWDQLAETIIPTINEMYKQNRETRKNSRSYDDSNEPYIDIINTVEDSDFEDDYENDELPTDEEKAIAGKEKLAERGKENPTDEQGIAYVNNKVNIEYIDNGPGPAFQYKPLYSSTIITVNVSHKFYTEFLSKIYQNQDVKTTFELFLASFFKAVRKTDTYQSEENDRLLTNWYIRLNDYISEQLNPRNVH